MARGGHASPPLSSLPKVSFQKIQDDVSTQPCGVHDGQARAFGYNDFSEFQRPDSYIRHIEPLESELAKQVEYDMDEQDKEWLDALNRERRKEQMTQISYELFEVVMDRLEKEWFDLTKNITKPDLALPSEDSTCAICDDAEGENSNAIVFCDGCNLAVHQDCYGVPYIPEGQWLCRKCTVSPENPVSCILCPNEGGAFKQTIHGDWVHLLCAIWVPETRVANDVFMEPITGVDKISKQRWKLKCYVCEIREGACIQCAKTSCFLAFHATCARKERLLLPMKGAQGAEPMTLTCFCDRHLPKEQQEIRAAALAADEALEESPSHNAKLSKSARAYAKTYKPGPPLVPAIVVTRIEYYVRRFKISKRIPTLQMMCRYWSLKREARRGAPLLKRLHLEPWTANAGGKVQTDEEKLMKLDQLNHLLYDMEGLRDLTFSAKKREKWKLEQARAIYDVLESSLLIHSRRLRAAFDRITGLDRQEFFRNPVSKADVPDYFDIIKKPMCWTIIETKLDKHEYWDFQAFKNDIDLVIDNAILYNKPGTPFHKTALRIQTAAGPILEGLRQLSVNNNVSDGTPDALAPIGDLEPPLELLELLLSTDAIKDDIDLVLADTPLASLFSFELPRAKPPPPPPTPPPPKPPKVKRDRKAEYLKRKQEREAAAVAAAVAAMEADKEALESTTKPRTTRAMAAAAVEPELESIVPLLEAKTEEPTRELSEDVRPSKEATPESAPESSASASKRGRQKKRASTSVAPPTDLLPLVDSVDNQQSFKMFNMGWILPPEQRRGGRAAPVDRQSVSVAPRPWKRARTDAGPSRLSVDSTAASENQALEEFVSFELESSTNDVPMEVDLASAGTPSYTPLSTMRSRRPPHSSSVLESDASLPPPPPLPPVQVVQMENGTIVLEELDTPAIRRLKTLRRKEEKEKRMAEQAAAAALTGPGTPGRATLSLAPPRPTSAAGPSRALRRKKSQDADSDLSSLSDFGSEAAPRTISVPGRSKKRGRGRAAASVPVIDSADGLGQVVLTDGRMLEGGTLVWAKADTYPWWPAVIYEDNDPAVPPQVLRNCLDTRQKRKNVIHILQFFDKSKSWQYLPLERLRMLGEDNTLDDDMLAANSVRQKWKSATMRESCRDSYQEALAEMETTSDLAENEEKGQHMDVLTTND
ncbi:hypothetical protein D9615_006509 [Tricholomella constricta]|uniref:Peregrin n=1 Tax=Tricholomella constricta TaxID=117010 RepID=A0A8H5HAB0_9AGAR|nr:hypothetical protein D9615_006509 [Tricholomella constricta]